MAARSAAGDDVLACTDALLPLDDERRTDWAIWLAFWGMAVSDPGFSREQRRRVRSTRQFLGAVIENAAAAGELPEDTDAEWMAAELLTAVNGVAVQAMFDPLTGPWSGSRRWCGPTTPALCGPDQASGPPAHHRSNMGRTAVLTSSTTKPDGDTT